MIAGLSVLALIPARGGSKGLPGKNIRLAGGRPLIHYTIEAARAAHTVDRVVLSSDDDAIIDAARTAGCEVPFKRPPHLATDEAASIDVVLHALDVLPPHDLVVLLQPTSPLRGAADVDAACVRLVECDAPSCVSVTLAEHSPYWMYAVDSCHRMQPLLHLPKAARRQELPAAWRLNGAVYVARTDWLRRTRSFVGAGSVAHEMPAERALDIDTLDDFEHFTRMLSGAYQ